MTQLTPHEQRRRVVQDFANYMQIPQELVELPTGDWVGLPVGACAEYPATRRLIETLYPVLGSNPRKNA